MEGQCCYLDSGHSCQGSVCRMHEILNSYSYSTLEQRLQQDRSDSKGLLRNVKREWRDVLPRTQSILILQVIFIVLHVMRGSVCASLIIKMPDKFCVGRGYGVPKFWSVSPSRNLFFRLWMQSYNHQHGACVRPPEDNTELEIETRSLVGLQGVEHAYPTLIRDQGKLATPGETRDHKRSRGGQTLALWATALTTTAVFQPHPQVSNAVRLIVS